LPPNIAAPIESLVGTISTGVLYPQRAANFRADPKNFALKYYTENFKVFISILLGPASVGGGAYFVIAALHPARYAQSAAVLPALMLRSAFLSFASPAKDLLIAAGHDHVILHGNVFRVAGLLAASLTGYFLRASWFRLWHRSERAAPLGFYLWLQWKQLLVPKYELYNAAFMLVVAVVSYSASNLRVRLPSQ
jgi:hypothetical protein